ncbi:hypothetical protein SERLA73DRAFT_190476 [Serpula lacrymans var. lacrymans S7.3]|uniref:Uncharacterized protein n=1 Tax=Serpula lacrymans var. lacrymans (strain S7.3) TaxID=936435 RepID=F8QFP4_SERL3|nr:hypothetical protein SERLA73DRAFT_190476 [Serpula lacrymans var. lacrymans S7.3]
MRLRSGVEKDELFKPHATVVRRSEGSDVCRCGEEKQSSNSGSTELSFLLRFSVAWALAADWFHMPATRLLVARRSARNI